MNPVRTRPTSFRLSPLLLNALKAAALRERRSQANMLEVMVREYCQQHGVDVSGEPKRPEGST
jgi:hypothetical protein